MGILKILSRPQHGTGWRKEPFDSRDKLYRISAATIGDLPESVDMRPQMAGIPVEDQQDTNSCVGHAATTAMEILCDQKRAKHAQLSRMFVYYGSRWLINETDQDAGCYIRDAVKVLAKQGVCRESLWPFGPSRLFAQPSNNCFTDAKNNMVTEYQRISSLVGVKDALARNKPVIFGTAIFDSFMTRDVARTGRAPFPRLTGVLRERMVGMHAMVAIGYSDTEPFKRPGGSGVGCVLVRNSWGRWGMGGDCWMPYPFFQSANLTNDIWCISKVEVVT